VAHANIQERRRSPGYLLAVERFQLSPPPGTMLDALRDILALQQLLLGLLPPERALFIDNARIRRRGT
jgi:hypothetical protein